MSIQRNQIVLVDTNVIIEAHRSGCLGLIADHFRLYTVEKVIAETQANAQNRRPEQNIDEAQLRAWMSDIYTVTAEMRFDFNVQFSHPPLDAGERDLMIRALTLEDVWLLNSPDLAAVRFAHSRGLIDRLVSLEAMCGLIKARLRADLWTAQPSVDTQRPLSA